MADYELVAVSRVPQSAAPPALAEIGPIVAPTITWKRSLNGPGSIGFACTADRLPREIAERLVDPLNLPTELRLYRDGVPMQPAFVAGYQVQGSGRTMLSVTAPGLLDYLRYMLVDADLTFTGIDQHLIGKALVDQWQALPYGNYGIDTSGITASGVLRDRTYIAAEQHEVAQRLRELGAVNNGFDIDLDPATRALVFTSPSQGSDLSESVVLDRRNLTDPGVTVSVGPGDIASDALGVGTSDQPLITSRPGNATVRATWGRAGVSGTFDGVSVQSTLDGHAQAMLDARSTALLNPGPGLVPVDGAAVGDFDIGDLVTYEFDAGLGMQSGVFRVVEIEVTVGENGHESLAVAFA